MICCLFGDWNHSTLTANYAEVVRVSKVPEIRLPHECDSAAKTQSGSFNYRK